MNQVNTLLSELGELARRESSPTVDVRVRVLQTIDVERRVAKLDLVPIAFGGVAITVAATFVISLLPSWQTMFEPWVSYFQK